MKLRLIKTAVSLLSGALLFLSCADFNIWPFTWFAIVPLLWVILDEKTEKPAVYGFLCGLVANGGGFYWIVGFLERFGHLPFIASAPIFLLLVSYQAITFAVFAWIVRRLRDRLDLGVTFIAPVAYVAVELVVPYVFPWYLAITQAWVRPVIQIADLTGPLGVSFLLVLVNGALYEITFSIKRKQGLPRRRLIAAGLIVVGALVYGQVRIRQVERARADGAHFKVGVVQANIGIHEKWRPDLAATQLQVHQRVSRSLELRGANLIVWPESSYPHLFRRDQSHDWPGGDERRAQLGFQTPLLFGALTASVREPYPFNSALLLDAHGDVNGVFDKNILMVFGEYIPYFEQMKFIKRWIPEASNLGRGTDVEVFPLTLPSGQRVNLGPMICYEDIFPSFGRRLTKKQPNLLVNITNDAWFGRTSEPYEHMALSVYRAVETRLDLVRAVNTGVSAFIDSTGRVYDTSPSVDPDETPDAKPVGLLNEVSAQTAFTFYSTLGEWFGGLCMLILVILGIRARARAGLAVRWPLVGLGAAALFGTIALTAAILCGPAKLGVALALVAHRAVTAGPDVTFAVGVMLAPAILLGSIACGIAVTHARHGRAPLESALAVLAILVAPALALGTLEGEQAGLVLTALAGILIAAIASRLYSRRFKT